MNPPQTTERPPRDRQRGNGNGHTLQHRPIVPRLTVLQAIQRYWLIVLLPAVILGVVGAALALSRSSTYTSEAKVTVGKASPSSPAFAGSGAASALADTYSNAVYSDSVVTQVAHDLKWSPGLVRSRLSATAVPTSPIIRVIGTAPSAKQAEAVANSAAAVLKISVASTNRINPDADRLFALYRQAALAKAKADDTFNTDNRRLQNSPQDQGLRRLVVHDTAVANANNLRVDSLSAAFTHAQEGDSATDVIQPLSPAVSATSNRSKKLQTTAAAGVLAGLVIGIALASAMANRSVRRRLAS